MNNNTTRRDTLKMLAAGTIIPSLPVFGAMRESAEYRRLGREPVQVGRMYPVVAVRAHVVTPERVVHQDDYVHKNLSPPGFAPVEHGVYTGAVRQVAVRDLRTSRCGLTLPEGDGQRRRF